MNQRLIKRICEIKRDGSLGTNLDSTMEELLFSRGLTTKQEIDAFLYPNEQNLIDPKGLSGIEAAAERIRRAASDNETVLIFGDYDVDGVCAAAIIYKTLTKMGIGAVVHIPHRINEGYGLNIDTLDELLDEHMPALVVTCDCGISCAREVEHLLDLGIDVVVTDHHEVPEILPDCPCVNPKIKGQIYGFSELCGASVAFKLAQYLLGLKDCYEYLSLAALATVADMVSLLGENRLIVQLGLRELNNNKNLGITLLAQSLGIKGAITSADIAFKFAPRLNAAGRIKSARLAYDLLTSEDEGEIESIINELEKLNALRKKECDNILREINQCYQKGFGSKRIIILKGKGWHKGVIGIVAAKLSNQHRRPVFLAVESDGVLYGTARGIEGMDVHSILCGCSDLLIKFGGHQSAAGYALNVDSFEEFSKRATALADKIDASLFLPTSQYDLDIEVERINLAFAEQIELLQPFGKDNERPIFRLRADEIWANPLKNYPQHLCITHKKQDIMAFNYANMRRYLNSEGIKDLLLQIEVNDFNNQKSARCILKDFFLESEGESDEAALLNYLGQLYSLKGTKEGKADYTIISEGEISRALTPKPFGTLFITFDCDTYSALSNRMENVVFDSGLFRGSNHSRVFFGSMPPFDLEMYDEIYIVDSPLCEAYIKKICDLSGARVFSKQFNSKILHQFSLTRAELKEYYNIIKNSTTASFANLTEFCIRLARLNLVKSSALLIALMVFLELGLFKIGGGGQSIEVCDGVRANLDDSTILKYINAHSEATHGK